MNHGTERLLAVLLLLWPAARRAAVRVCACLAVQQGVAPAANMHFWYLLRVSLHTVLYSK